MQRGQIGITSFNLKRDDDDIKERSVILTAKYSDGHGGVHEEQHIEEQESEVGQHLAGVVADVVVQGADQYADQDVSEETEVHERLEGRREMVSRLVLYMETICFL